MSRDLRPHYRDVQVFKAAHAHGSVDGALMERLRKAVNEQLARKNLSEQERNAALYSVLSGMSWLAAMCERYAIDPDTLLDPPAHILANVLYNSRGLALDSLSVELGIGAGYFTGLLVGLKAGSP